MLNISTLNIKNKNNSPSQTGSGESEEKNNGGLLGGLGYLFGNLGLGIASTVEGVADMFIAAGPTAWSPAAALFLGIPDAIYRAKSAAEGKETYAQEVFKNNVVGEWHESLIEEYNPGEVMSFAGDVLHGIGQSSAFLLDALVPGMGSATFFLGTSGQSISSAADKTGEVGAKEVAYGLASGGVELALGKALDGMSTVAKGLTKGGLKNVTKSAIRKGLGRQVMTSAASEFGEEFITEYTDTILQRATGVDKNATTTLKDALYAGLVGAVSGGLTTGVAGVSKNIGNQKRGANIIKNGNSQTLVNTANMVADRLAAEGTNFENAADWITALRGQVDAYNKLSENEKTGISGQTILGEMQASLFFAETQANVELIKKKIQNKSEQDKATIAEYVSRVTGKKYTVADIDSNKDNLTGTLAVLDYVSGIADLDGALADMQQESEIADVVAKQGGEVAQGANDVNPSSVADATAFTEGEGKAVMPQMAGARPAMQFDLDENAVNLRSDAVEVEGEQMGAETLQNEAAGASPSLTSEFGGQSEVIDGATAEGAESPSSVGKPTPSPEGEGSTKVDHERAKRDAERIIEWERKEAPTVDELNRVRGAVKNFDSLSGDRQRAIVRMVRSGKNIDEGVIRGVSNIMAITNKKGAVLAPDVEIRFAEFGKDSTRRGIKTEVGDKTVILLNANAKSTDILRGTIAHEIVHYLENRKGYKALAEYAMKHAKAEKVAQVRETYEGVYEGENAEAKIEGEVVASVVAELLGNEKFLKRYAQMGEEQSSVVKRIARFVKGIANALKDKDEGVSREAQNLMLLIDRALLSQQLETENQNKANTEYDIGSKTEEKTTPPFDKESDAVLYLSENNEEFKELSEKWVSLSKDEKEGQVGKKIEARQKELIDSVMAKSSEQTKDSDTSTKKPPKKKAKKSNSQKKEKQSKEQAAKKAVDALFADTVRTYTKSEFRSIFERVKSIAPENLGKIIEGKTVGMRGSDIDQMLSDVYIAMYQASYKGNVGAVEAIQEIARSAAKYYIEHQSVYNQEENKYVSLKRYIDDADILKSYEDALVEELYKSFAEAGRDLSNYRNLSFIREQMEQYRSKYLNFKEMTKYRKRASDSAIDLKHLANTQKRAAADEGVRLLAKAMGDTVDKHGNVRVQKIDAAIAHASDFYNAETNTKFFGEENSKSLVDYAQKFDRRIRENLDILIEMRKDRQGKPLTMIEMKLWAEILGGMRATINEYNGLYLQSKWFDRTQVAMDLANSIVDFFGYQADKNPKNKFLGGLSNVARKINENFFYSVLTPEAVIEGLEGYAAKGILKTFFRSVRDATQLAEKQYFELVMPFTNFFESKENSWQDGKKTYKYDEKLENKKIDLFGNEITLGEAIYTYGLTKREHAQAGLAGEGIKIYDKDGRIKKHIREIDAEKARDWLYGQFDETDKKFVKIVEEFFNKTSTEIKERSDLEYLGYTNTIEGYYIPILRDRLSRDARTTDKRSTIFDTITVYNERFNKNTVKNAKPCEVTNITSVISMHAKGLADYANLYMPLKSFDRLYNSPVVLADGRNTTIREILNDVWPDSKNYLSDLFGDIQGISRKTGNFDTINELAQKLTDKWVPSVLSANVSVVLTQTTSYVAAFQDIEMRYLTRALGIVGRNWSELAARADKYSKITLARNSDQGAMRAQTNVEKVGKIGKILGVPTEWTDRQIVLLIYHACELKAEAEGAGQIGSEANAKRAAELCDQTIYDTQSMTSRAERSAWQRSPNLFARAITQFTSDAMKQLSHLYTNIMKYFAHRKRAKMNPNDTTYKAMLGKDRKAILRSATTVAATSAAMAGAAWAIRMLFNTAADEPEEEWSTVGWDFVGNIIGIIPLVSDIYDLFKDGYDITPTSMEIVNDTVTYFRDAIDVLGAATRKEYLSDEDIIKPAKNMTHAVAALLGWPTKPIEKTVVGLVRRVSPSSTYWWDSMFSPSSYTKDLQNALDKGDEKMASAVLETLWKNDINSAYVEEELLEIMRLYQIVDENGEYRDEVLPNRIPDIKSAKQRAQFEEIYGKASGAVIQLINSLEYQNLTDEKRIVAISNTYKLWYNTAKSDVLGEEITNSQAYAKLLQDTSNLFIAQSKKKFMAPYKTLRGKEVTVKEQLSKYLDEMEIDDTERLIIMYALGYRSKENKTKLLAYINSLNMSENDLTQIANRLGFQVVDGKMKEVEEELEVRAE